MKRRDIITLVLLMAMYITVMIIGSYKISKKIAYLENTIEEVSSKLVSTHKYLIVNHTYGGIRECNTIYDPFCTLDQEYEIVQEDAHIVVYEKNWQGIWVIAADRHEEMPVATLDMEYIPQKNI